jgi:hypothetical protein
MAKVVRISELLIQKALLMSKIEKRSLTGQIEHWAQIGQIAEENPDLSYSMIKEMLIGMAEIESGKMSQYQFDRE